MIKTILVVPDPGRKKTWLQLQEHTYTDWVLTSLPHQEVEYLLGITDLDGLIFVATSQRLSSKEVPKGHRVVHINEVLLMWHTIDTSTKNCLQARYMNFRTFSEIIFMSLDRLQKAMANFAAVWGGLDLTKNHREGPVSFRRSNSSRILAYSGLRCTFEKYMWALHRLEDVLPVWPGTLECRAASHDRNAISLLDSIARDVTKSHRPTTQLINPESKPAARACQHVVVKREASASSQHIKYPWNEEMPADQEGYQLLMQPYVPEWDQVGQWRCLLIDRALFCIFIHPGSYTLSQHHSCVSAHSLREDGWSLEELGLIRESNPDQCHFMIREGGTRAEVFKAHAEIQQFLVLTLEAFIAGEETRLFRYGIKDRLRQSSLRVSARLDLSVITNPESRKLQYFVTGISRGPGMMLYGSVDANTIHRYALEFARPFECWIGPRDPRPQTMILN
ncbi:uncharacterized protein F5891DRAFT_1197804 [Suillus fuscotomentosus]|uniref:Uncharacterized protein n=1 Tax=Suillus fuscotomentosus TaxID=1912939 RepID=A0AAD4HCD2_9AGAM|nr:uncharacterized protein F5891DRAFT_1197804 [Suillus fuscotomentosus]KAG1890720.1 hypothetical protein F5891DRAFT_1197804 [Suillus fuscotomentosus]